MFKKSAAPSGYFLTKSLRFRSSASAYLNRTPASASNRQTWTWSGWVKRGTFNSTQFLFDASVGATQTSCYFRTGDYISMESYDGTNDYFIVSSAVYRDPSAWYHIMFVFDTTNATAANRMKMYVNGVQITSYSASAYPTQNLNGYINNNQAHNIAKQASGTAYFDGYMAEVNFVDGQALTPSSFGSTNATTGVWQPAKYTGTYGTNGFYLPFTDTTSTTTLGYDFSGNGNNWTTNNLSLTTGSTYDSMTDVPTLTSATQANYCVINPLDYESSTFTLSNANLTFAGARTATGSYYARSTVAVTSGQWYWEVTPTDVGGGPNLAIGIQSLPSALTGGGSLTLNGYAYGADGLKWNNGGTASYGATWTNGDVIGIAYDATAGTITFYKNNTSQGTAFTGITAGTYTPIIEMATGGVARTVAGSINFGQQGFTYTPPTGYVALNTYNLPTSTIVKGNTVMNVLTWSGAGGLPSATRSLTGLGFKPDFVWEKNRASGQDHHLFDSVRGAGLSKTLASNSTGAEGGFNDTLYGYLSSFDSDGMTTTNGASTWDNWNKSGDTYVGWCWQAGQGSTSSNTSGSITSTVSVNATAGFSIVTYTGTGANATVGHGLGVSPSMIIVKLRSNSDNWTVYRSDFSSPSGDYLQLNTTSAKANYSVGNGIWNGGANSSTFGVGPLSAINQTSQTLVAYCWAEIAGFSKFGSYTGNGSTDGPFVYTGFRPKFVMIKRTDGAADWMMIDTTRSPFNVEKALLQANLSNAEDASTELIDGLSNGFKLRNSAYSSLNTNGGTYIYMAFAENPFKNALAR